MYLIWFWISNSSQMNQTETKKLFTTKSYLFLVLHFPKIHRTRIDIEAQEMNSSCWLFVVKAEQRKRREVYQIYLLMQTNNNFTWNRFKEKAHTCVVYASEYNRRFIKNFRRLSLQSFRAIQLAEFSFGIKKINEIYHPGNFIRNLFILYFYLLFFCRFFFRFSSFISSTSNEWTHRKGVTLLTFYPLLHRCASIEIFQFSSFSQICLFSIFIFGSLPARQIFISLSLRWFSSLILFFFYY